MRSFTEPETLKERLQHLDRFRVAVVGDLILDEYLVGRVDRISPEAPVPVVNLERRTVRPGGAANVALNLRAIGVQTALFGVVGTDAQGWELQALLQAEEVGTQGIVALEDRPTTVKTRVVSRRQQIVRLDREDPSPVPPQALDRMFQALRDWHPDAVILEDYNKGLLNAETLPRLRDLLNPVWVAVDPKEENLEFYRGVHLLKPNRRELEHLAGRRLSHLSQVQQAAREVYRRLAPEHLVVTLGEEGMWLVAPHLEAHVPALPVEVYDVTGAGDTAIAFLTVGFLLGLDPVEATALACLAAGLKVQKFGAARIPLEELLAALDRHWTPLLENTQIHQGGNDEVSEG